MSRRGKSKGSDSPMPATGAGLIRFYSESDSPGIKVQPMMAVIFTLLLIGLIFVVNVVFKPTP